jgi:hypothetical protein
MQNGMSLLFPARHTNPWGVQFTVHSGSERAVDDQMMLALGLTSPVSLPVSATGRMGLGR